MEDRFKDREWNSELANKIINETGFPVEEFEPLLDLIAEYRWTMFIADCSDDYFGRTIPEQQSAKQKMITACVAFGANEKATREFFKWNHC